MSAVVPTDAKAREAWDRIMKIAREHCLVVQAYGGSATLATPEAQREHGIRDKVLMMHSVREHDGEQVAMELPS